MMSTNTDDLRIQNLRELVVPEALIAELPAEEPLAEQVNASRGVIQSILEQADDRLVVVVGPCSIHDPEAAMDYAARLKTLAHEVSEDIFVVMRVYFEKPRTTVGWKGLINDPHLDNSFDVNEGLRRARQDAPPPAREPSHVASSTPRGVRRWGSSSVPWSSAASSERSDSTFSKWTPAINTWSRKLVREDSRHSRSGRPAASGPEAAAARASAARPA